MPTAPALPVQTATAAPLILRYPPSMNSMYRHIVIGGRARTLLTKAARDYKAYVANVCIVEKRTPFLKPANVMVLVNVFRPRRAGDLDNTLKVVLDAMSGYLYEDDSQIAAIHAYRHDDKRIPRIELTVVPIP